jgi:hypothetical protein
MMKTSESYSNDNSPAFQLNSLSGFSVDRLTTRWNFAVVAHGDDCAGLEIVMVSGEGRRSELGWMSARPLEKTFTSMRDKASTWPVADIYLPALDRPILARRGPIGYFRSGDRASPAARS